MTISISIFFACAHDCFTYLSASKSKFTIITNNNYYWKRKDTDYVFSRKQPSVAMLTQNRFIFTTKYKTVESYEQSIFSIKHRRPMPNNPNRPLKFVHLGTVVIKMILQFFPNGIQFLRLPHLLPRRCEKSLKMLRFQRKTGQFYC